MQDEQLEGGTQAAARVVARAVMLGRDVCEEPQERCEFARQHVRDHLTLGLSQNVFEAACIAAGLVPNLLELVEAAPVHQDARDHIEPFVACGSVNAGELRQPLSVSQDLFDDNVEALLAMSASLSDQLL